MQRHSWRSTRGSAGWERIDDGKKGKVTEITTVALSQKTTTQHAEENHGGARGGGALRKPWEFIVTFDVR